MQKQLNTEAAGNVRFNLLMIPCEFAIFSVSAFRCSAHFALPAAAQGAFDARAAADDDAEAEEVASALRCEVEETATEVGIEGGGEDGAEEVEMEEDAAVGMLGGGGGGGEFGESLSSMATSSLCSRKHTTNGNSWREIAEYGVYNVIARHKMLMDCMT